MNVQAFPDAILSKINEYLTQQSKPQLQMMDELKKTSKLAVEQILQNDSSNIRLHSNIEEWQEKVQNYIFTEMCFNVIVNVSDQNQNYYYESFISNNSIITHHTNMSVGTIMSLTAEMFAQNIMELLESGQLLMNLDQYTHCGISIVSTFPDQYLTIIHLVKLKYFTSCKEAAEKGTINQDVELLINGEKKIIYCGEDGWSLVQTVDQYFINGGVVQIDDLGLDYDEILIKAGDKNLLDYSESSTQWRTVSGFNFKLHIFKFGEKWYQCYEIPNPTSSWKDWFMKFDTSLHLNKYFLSDIEIIEGISTCQLSKENYPNYCAKSFVMKKLGGQKLTQISDVEFLTKYTTSNNEIYYQFELYIR